MRYILFLAIIISLGKLFAQDTKNPSDFLGYPLGDRFTYHHEVVDYFQYVADIDPRVLINHYGETYEHRPLIAAFISSKANIDRLEEIRTDNLKRAGIIEGKPVGGKVSIVWLSYNVHGNEANSMEASMSTLFELVKRDSKSGDWLENTLVVIDPCINPDGRDRYAQWYRRVANVKANPNQGSIEHHEPWPGGRANHYLYDLNRDWAWQTQIESQERMALYNKWLPHVHVDFHEMYVNNSYYFAPAADPYHEVISSWQREFQVIIGKNNAQYFDKKGWLYFTRETFDLLYPGYGDTYPIFNGAIGMTYEQAGHGKAGLKVVTETGDTLTLSDRLVRHLTTGFSTIETTAQNYERVVDEFEKYFDNSLHNPSGTYLSYIIKESNPDKLKALTRLLDNIGIEYSKPEIEKRLSGYHFQSGRDQNFQVNESDLLISMYQPKSNFVRVLFEPSTQLLDSITYDITAWSIPYAYDLNTYGVKTRISSAGKFDFSFPVYKSSGEKPYAYISRWQSLKDVKFLSQLIQNGIKARYARHDFVIEGVEYKAGSLILARGDNMNLGDRFDIIISQIAAAQERDLKVVTTGLTDKGKDLGSGSVKFIGKPRVAVLSGEQTSVHSYGEFWYYFDQEIGYQFDALGTDYFDQIDLSDYDVLIVPHGKYNLFTEELIGEILEWTSGGGRLILLQDGMKDFAEQSGFGLKASSKETAKEEFAKYGEKDPNKISMKSTGSIFKVEMDNTHPLAFGYPGYYYTLKNNSLDYPLLENGWNVGYIRNSSSHISGFTGAKLKARINNTLIFGVEEIGKGEVIYITDNVLFRSFWENGKLLIANAIFFR